MKNNGSVGYGTYRYSKEKFLSKNICSFDILGLISLDFRFFYDFSGYMTRNRNYGIMIERNGAVLL